MSLETNKSWPGFSAAESLHWSRALLHHSPQPLPAGIKAQMATAIAKGRVVTAPEWVRTAEAARDIGFTAALYHSLFTALSHIDSNAFTWHPRHRETTLKNHPPGQPFEPELWKDWPNLVLTDGFTPRIAAEFVLLNAELSYRS